MEVIKSPQKYFSKPERLYRDAFLSNDEKHRALMNWKNECIQQSKSSQEGMSGRDQSSVLKSINEYLFKLNSKMA